MKKYLLLSFCIITTSLFAQNLQWAHTLGGNGTDKPQHIELDTEGNVYVSGTFVNSIEFSDSDVILEALNGPDVYIYKRNSSGELLWAQRLGGIGEDHVFDMAIDANDNVLVVGDFLSTLVIGSGANSVTLNSAGHRDGFIVKYSGNGVILNAYSLGGASNNDDITTIGFDNDNNVLLAGRCEADVDFDFGSGTEIFENDHRFFILKLNPQLEFISVFKGIGNGIIVNNLITTDQGDYILSGSFTHDIRFGGTFPSNGLSTSYDGRETGFILKISSDGYYIWGSKIQGMTYQNVVDIAPSTDGSFILTGEFEGVSSFFDSENADIFVSSESSRDVFFAKISQTGVYEWIKIIGGAGVDEVSGVELANNQNIVLSGSYTETMDFDPSLNTAESAPEENAASYIATYTSGGEYLNVKIFQNATYNHASGIVLNETDEIYLSGWFTASIDFSPSQPDFDFESVGAIDTYLLKLNANTVGLNEDLAHEKFLIYPNPAHTEIHFDTPDTRVVEVFDIQGKLMLSKRLEQSISAQCLNVSQLRTGIYFIRLSAKNGTSKVEKIIINR